MGLLRKYFARMNILFCGHLVINLQTLTAIELNLDLHDIPSTETITGGDL